jgi:hypothetical protein
VRGNILVVVYDLNFMSVLTTPAKADAPLVIDPDAVLAAAPAFEGFQAVAERQAHDVESVGGIELEEFSPGRALDIGWQVTRGGAGKEPLGLRVDKASDHGMQRNRSADWRK